MAMYAEATKTNYSPEYRYQTPEYGRGATADPKDKGEVLPRDDRAALNELMKAIDDLAKR